MEHSQKVTLTPFENEPPPILHSSSDSSVEYSSNSKPYTTTVGTQTIKKVKSHPILEKLVNQIKIILKLAKIEGYDDNLRIKNEYGNYIENSNIINLLQNATISAKILVGQDSFIDLLFKAHVDPDLIVNENVKIKLIRLYENKSRETQTDEREPLIFTKSAPTKQVSVEPIVKSTKRKREKINEIDNSDEPPHKKSNWIIPESENNE
jgi:hypothetical protein